MLFQLICLPHVLPSLPQLYWKKTLQCMMTFAECTSALGNFIYFYYFNYFAQIDLHRESKQKCRYPVLNVNDSRVVLPLSKVYFNDKLFVSRDPTANWAWVIFHICPCVLRLFLHYICVPYKSYRPHKHAYGLCCIRCVLQMTPTFVCETCDCHITNVPAHVWSRNDMKAKVDQSLIRREGRFATYESKLHK